MSEKCQQRKSLRLPRISHHALAGVGARYIGELALEGGSGGPAVQPFLLGGGGNEGSVVRLGGAPDDEGWARHRQECRTDIPVGISIICPRPRDAQLETSILHL